MLRVSLGQTYGLPSAPFVVTAEAALRSLEPCARSSGSLYRDPTSFLCCAPIVGADELRCRRFAPGVVPENAPLGPLVPPRGTAPPDQATASPTRTYLPWIVGGAALVAALIFTQRKSSAETTITVKKD